MIRLFRYLIVFAFVFGVNKAFASPNDGFKELPGFSPSLFNDIQSINSIGDIGFEEGDVNATNIAKFVSAQKYMQDYKEKISSYDCGDDDSCAAEKSYLEAVASYNSSLIDYYYKKARGESATKPSFSATKPSSCSSTCTALTNSVSSVDYDELDAKRLIGEVLYKFPACTNKKTGLINKRIQLSSACQDMVNAYVANMVYHGSVNASVKTVNYSGPALCSPADNFIKHAGSFASIAGGACNSIMAKGYAKGKFDVGDTKTLKKCAVCSALMPKVATICDKAINAAYMAMATRNQQIFAQGQQVAGPGGQFPTTNPQAYAQNYNGGNNFNPTATPSLSTQQGINSYYDASTTTYNTAQNYNQQNRYGDSYENNASTQQYAYNLMNSFYRGSGDTNSNNFNPFRGAGRGDKNTDVLTKVSNGSLDYVQALEQQKTLLKEKVNPELYDQCYVASNTAVANYILNPSSTQSMLDARKGCFQANLQKGIVVSNIITIKRAMLCKKYSHCQNTELDLVGLDEVALNEDTSFSGFALSKILRDFYAFASTGGVRQIRRRPRISQLGPLQFKEKRYKIHSWKDIIRARIDYLNYMWDEYKRTVNIYKVKVKRILRKKLPVFRNIPSPNLALAQLKYVKRLRSRSKKALGSINKLVAANKKQLRLAMIKGNNKKVLKLKAEQKQIQKLKYAINRAYTVSRKTLPIFKKTFDNIYEFRKNYYTYWYLRNKFTGKR